MSVRVRVRRQQLPCPVHSCPRTFKSQYGRTNHVRTAHENTNYVHGSSESDRSSSESLSNVANNEDQYYLDDSVNTPPPQVTPPPQPLPQGPRKIYHPHLTGWSEYFSCILLLLLISVILGSPCDEHGLPLPPETPPPPRVDADHNDWSPYEDEIQFRAADFLFRKDEMSVPNIDYLMELWAMSMAKHDDLGPFDSYDHLYATIDATKLGDAPWKCFSATFSGPLGPDAPSWKLASYQVWYRDPDVVIRNLLDNPDFNGQFDYAPYVQLDKDGNRRWSDFMSGNFSWRHCVRS